MKTSLTEKYELIIEPESVVEMLALRAWNENEGKSLLIKAYDAEQKMHPTNGGLSAADELSNPATTGG